MPISILSNCTVRIKANLESYNYLGGFWTSTDATSCPEYSLGFNDTSCEYNQYTIPSSYVYTSSPIEINIGYDDTNLVPGFDDDGGVKEVKFTFNGWTVPAGTFVINRGPISVLEMNPSESK